MKTLLKTFGLIVIATLFGLSMMACGGDSGGNDPNDPNDPNVPGPGPGGGPIALTENVWKDGTITSASGKLEYTFSVKVGSTYRIWWTDKGQGDGTQTGNIKVSAWYGNSSGTEIFTEEDSAYTTAKNFLPTSDGTVFVRVELKDNDIDNAGTFAIVYSTGYSRQMYFPASAVPMTINKWENGRIDSTTNSSAWYKFSVIAETDYYLWWNSSNQGDNTKTMDIRITAWYSNGTSIITYASGARAGWTTPQTFTPESNDTVYIQVSAYWSSIDNTGTYGIVYGDGSTRPPLHSGVTAVPLVEKVWTNGEIINGDTLDWYSFSVTNGETYYIWWNKTPGNTYSDGDGTKTGNVTVFAYYSNGTGIFTDASVAWGTTRTFTASSDSTVYIRVLPNRYYSDVTGTYGIVYNTVNKRPLDLPAGIVPLTEGSWTDGDISGRNDFGWHSVPVTSGTYYIWWNKGGGSNLDGDGSKTYSGYVSAWYSDGTVVFTDREYAWASPQTVTVTSNDTIYIRVSMSTISSTRAGTYGITFTTYNGRPLILPDNITQLSQGQWTDGETSTSSENSANWYSFPVSGGTTYYFWMNNSNYGDGSKTGGSIRVKGVFSNGTPAFSDEIQSAWTTPQTITPSSDDTVYLLVYQTTTTGSLTRTYGITYTTVNTRPVVPTP
jgi:hypothetical protein